MNLEIDEHLPTLKSVSNHELIHNPCLGYTFMVVSMTGLTLVHLMAKVAYTRKPELTSIDCTFFMGFWLAVVYFIWAQITGVSLSLKGLTKKALIALTVSLIATGITNVCMFQGLALIAVGKSTLIFSTNPMFSMILAYFVLKEQISSIVILSTLGAFVGIYFLSLNKQNNEEETHVYIGVGLVLVAAFFQAVIFVTVRIISVNKIHFVVRPFYVGIIFLMFSGILSTFKTGEKDETCGLTFNIWDSTDVFLMSGVGIGSGLGVGPLSIAMKYERAAKLSPILYFENVFTLFSDAVIFNYHFILFDYIGIVIVSVGLSIPAIIRIKNDH